MRSFSRWMIVTTAAALVGGVLLLVKAGAVRTNFTIEERLKAFGPAVKKRLAGDFAKAGLPYPPKRLLMVAFKDEAVLDLYASAKESGPFTLIRRYPVLGASGKLGPKLREGDRQVPEGVYRVEYLNPNSRFHLSMKLNYPNPFDLRHAKAEGRTKPGSDIMIHGDDVSIGCLAMGDPAAEELFVLAALVGIEKVKVIIAPVDFRVRDLPAGLEKELPPWTSTLYERLRREVQALPDCLSEEEA